MIIGQSEGHRQVWLIEDLPTKFESANAVEDLPGVGEKEEEACTADVEGV